MRGAVNWDPSVEICEHPYMSFSFTARFASFWSNCVLMQGTYRRLGGTSTAYTRKTWTAWFLWTYPQITGSCWPFFTWTWQAAEPGVTCPKWRWLCTRETWVTVSFGNVGGLKTRNLIWNANCSPLRPALTCNFGAGNLKRLGLDCTFPSTKNPPSYPTQRTFPGTARCLTSTTSGCTSLVTWSLSVRTRRTRSTARTRPTPAEWDSSHSVTAASFMTHSL